MMLSVEQLHFRYRFAQPVLNNISFILEQGQTLALLGPNGTGKTTLLRCLLGLNRAKYGHICVDQQVISSLSFRQRARLIAYVPQASALTFPYSVREVVLMGRLSHQGFGKAPNASDQDIVEQALISMGVEHLADKLIQQLSGGEKQLVLIARAIAQQARLLILDEPTASLDFANQVRVLKLISQLSSQGHTVLMTTHQPDHALAVADQVVLLKNGHVFRQGCTHEVVTSENLSLLYETPIAVTATQMMSTGKSASVCVPLMDTDKRERCFA